MLFSVLIPLYNSEKHIEECIESVLAQDFEDYEIVIVDDGSSDGGGAIADQYQEKHPQTIRVIHKENTGVLLTRRRLLQEAKGDYILWVDSDDVIKPALMKDLYGKIQKHHPDMLIYNYEYYDDAQQEFHSLFVPDGTVIEVESKHAVLIKLILGRDLNELWSKCIRREIIDIDTDYSVYRHVKEGDDLFCLLPIFDLTEKIVYLDRAYYRYRVIQTSITHAATYRRYYSYRTIFERIDQYIGKWKFTKEECSQVKDRFATQIVDCLVMCANSSDNTIESFIAFASDVSDDEAKRPIFSEEERKLSSKAYQRYYQLLIQKKYRKLYHNISTTTALSRWKNKLVRR